LIQLTFKDNYKTYGPKAGHPEIVENPDLVNDPKIAVKIACAYLKSKSISWSSFDFSGLGQEFRRAVGYADRGGAETNKRIGLGQGFASKLNTGDLTPVQDVATEPAGTNIEAGKRVNTDADLTTTELNAKSSAELENEIVEPAVRAGRPFTDKEMTAAAILNVRGADAVAVPGGKAEQDRFVAEVIRIRSLNY